MDETPAVDPSDPDRPRIGFPVFHYTDPTPRPYATDSAVGLAPPAQLPRIVTLAGFVFIWWACIDTALHIWAVSNSIADRP